MHTKQQILYPFARPFFPNKQQFGRSLVPKFMQKVQRAHATATKLPELIYADISHIKTNELNHNISSSTTKYH